MNTTTQGLVLTGTSGVGKSTVAGEVYEVLVARQPGSAMIDLDALAKCDAGEDRGFFGSTIMAENLSVIWPNYRRRGVSHLVMARAVPDRSELQRLEAAVSDITLTVCLLTADPAVLSERLAVRDIGALRGRRSQDAARLQARMIESGIPDFTIATDGASDLETLATEILRRWRDVTQSSGPTGANSPGL